MLAALLLVLASGSAVHARWTRELLQSTCSSTASCLATPPASPIEPGQMHSAMAVELSNWIYGDDSTFT